jgi:hypothetical protein
MSTTGSDDTAADARDDVEPGREGLPINREGIRVFTSTPGPALDNFQRDTLDVIRAERERAKWRPNHLDLPPGTQRNILNELPPIAEQRNDALDVQPPRKQNFHSAVEKGHHPEWTDARRVQQERFWGPYTQTTAASRDSIAAIDEVNDSEDAWSHGSVYDPGHPWDTHHDQHWARPHLFPLPKTQWKQRVEKVEMSHRQIRAPGAYWDPDKWDSEYKRRGCWVIPTGESLEKTKGFEMKLIPLGAEGNKYIKPLTHENLLFWIDGLDKLDPSKKNGKELDWKLKNSDRRVLSWKDQFNPPDYTETEWMEQYDEDSRHQWEDLLAIHPSEWKTRHQMGNTLPPPMVNDYTEWKARYEGDKRSYPLSPPIEGSEGGKRNTPFGGMPTLKVPGGDDDPDPKPVKSTSMNLGQKAAIFSGGLALVTGLIGLGKWAWDKFANKKEQEDEQVEDEEVPIEQLKKIKRSHPREWKRSIEYRTNAIWY